ncbi:HYR domain-containing protein [Segetibacter sp. 3557_3]|uniref:HYR-like domain-containing protein n=1 Tax=Segetibacter sp. 3557_3 TaxID=2547429 RepID=UPI0010591A12|nr:HYR domain-containing protein [Segetibacter sp. 3557_3]TDH21407.1 HYR domain-containing protein [Segetibacter sp. 3557_3]
MSTLIQQTKPLMFSLVPKKFFLKLTAVPVLLLLQCFYSINSFAQLSTTTCGYKVDVVSSFNGVNTTITYTITNTNPGNGRPGTYKDLSHWEFVLNPCIPPNKIKGGDGDYHTNPNGSCLGNNTPIIKFDRGTSGTRPTTYTLVLEGNYSLILTDAYFKAGNDPCCKGQVYAPICCKFEVTCPTNKNLGTFDCKNLNTIPGLPTSLDQLKNSPYNIVIGTKNCGTIRYKASDDGTPNVCSPANQVITRTITIWDDLDGDNQQDSNEEFAVCKFTYTIIADKTAPVITCAGNKTIECNATVVFDPPTVKDDCDQDPKLTYEDKTDYGKCGYTVTRTWTAKDDCGNQSSCSQVITVKDTKPPVITCAGNKTIECGTPVVFDPPTVKDDCDQDPKLTYEDKTDYGNCGYTITRTWTAKDDCGNQSTCSQVITVKDTKAPVITCAGDKTIECNATVVFDPPTVKDDCDQDPKLTYEDKTDYGKCGYTVTRTWTAKDDCGNQSSCSQVITVKDTKPPVITCAGNKTIECGTPVVFDPPTVKDDCDQDPKLTYEDKTDYGNCGYTITRTWTAKDDCGNQSSCSQVITVKDTKPPVITCVPDRTIECDEAVVFDPPTVTDDCDRNPELTYTDKKVYHSCGYTITRTWIAKDDCGNQSTADQVITVKDTKPPVITCAGNKTIECGTPVVFDPPTVKDDCDKDPKLTYEDKTSYGKCEYTVTRTWTAKDDCGNQSSCSQVITVKDTKPPVITCVPDKTIECDEAVVFDPPTVTDDCDRNPELTYTDKKVYHSCGYTITRTWIAKDDCGNQSTADQVITVKDTKPPVITCAGNKTIECGTPVVFDPPTVKDDCDKDPKLTYEDKTSYGKCEYTVTRTWTAKDDCGNQSSCSQVITVKDTKPPVITCVPDKTIECDEAVVFDPPTVTDDCDRNPELTYTDKKVYHSCGYTITRTWIAKDDCGNQSTADQVITVKDTKAPVITCAGNKTIECGTPVVFDPPTVKDDCDKDPKLTYEDKTDYGKCGYTVTRTWTAKDDCGNQSSCSQVITVNDTKAPVITCAQNKTIECNAIVVFDPPTVTDCDPNVVVNFTTAVSGNTHTRTWTATDACGNSSSCSQVIVVKPCPTEGCTPGYWKNHPEAWVRTAYTTGQTLESVFNVPNNYGLDNVTLVDALDGGGGPGVVGAANTLLRAAVAALLNASHSGVNYPRSTTDIINAVNAALSSGDRQTMLNLAGALDRDNNLGCPLNNNNATRTMAVTSNVSGVAPQSIGAEAKLLAPLTASASPNPFSSNIRFVVTSSTGGDGSITVYNTLGQKLAVVYSGKFAAGRSQTILYNVPATYRTNLFYIVRVGEKQVTGKLLHGK